MNDSQNQNQNQNHGDSDSDTASLTEIAGTYAGIIMVRRRMGYFTSGLALVAMLCIAAVVGYKLFGVPRVPVIPLVGLALLCGVVAAMLAKAWLALEKQIRSFQSEVEAIVAQDHEDAMMRGASDAVRDTEAQEAEAR